ncbi:hypothetical protein [Klebsiella phage Kp_GWPR59]|nr:hypothetical protein [Klebsiella phage Kp_GWPR59]
MSEIEGINELLKLVDVDINTGVITWKVKRGCRSAGSIAGSFSKSTGYNVIVFDRRQYLVHRVVFYAATGKLPKCVDHKKGKEYGDGIENLRESTQAQNARNRKAHKGSATGQKGVTPHGNKYRAQICVDGKVKYLGLFDTIEEAARVRDEASLAYHGEFAKLNNG